MRVAAKKEGSYYFSLSHHFERFTVVTMTYCGTSVSFWPLCCLLFFDLWIRITPLVSSNSADPVHKLPLPRIRILCINPDAVPTIRNHTTNMTLGLLVLLWNKKCFPIFCLMFLEPLFVYLSFFLLAILFFLSFYDLRCLFTPFGIFKKSLKIPKG